MRAADPDTIITPGKIYHALGKRADCGGCMPLFVDCMRNSAHFGVSAEGRQPIPQLRTYGGSHEGRRKGYRVSQRRAAV
ncbi:MAG: (2Fe-2S)-binding protein [Paracoccus sp. (in: a-proteobacteria)]|uniref:(2Fe-2S)-binding protein n=1 Tax=Paracoccus sp. TaxID=267 RepID=UPI0026DFA622|nr:(2Fe-2S)-binding protein [Paracoccus sp. (in: a-proteobacteria)]MDO5621971.1 (2Fe-2S)-binding protein [Paracoccus sp. (in: a-proteobacteria)]